MQTVLILASDDIIASLLADTASAAGCGVVHPRADETWVDAAARVPADVILIDVDAPSHPAIVRRIEELGRLVVIASRSFSSYELAAFARSHGVAHFNTAGGPAGLSRAIDDARALAALPTSRRNIAAAAAASVRRARDLTAQAGSVVATSNELRIANRIALAACRMNRQLLQETVVACTRDLRRAGMALDLVVELVTSAVEGSALDHPASRAEVQAEAEAAAQWAVEAWRAA